jgi:hypothetical protein
MKTLVYFLKNGAREQTQIESLIQLVVISSLKFLFFYKDNKE